MYVTFEYASKATEVHLVGTVKDDDVFSEASAHVFDGLRLTGACWAGRCPSHAHAKRLSQRDVAPVTR